VAFQRAASAYHANEEDHNSVGWVELLGFLVVNQRKIVLANLEVDITHATPTFPERRKNKPKQTNKQTENQCLVSKIARLFARAILSYP